MLPKTLKGCPKSNKLPNLVTLATSLVMKTGQKNTVTKSRTFRHVGDDDADEEDDGVEPVVAQDAGDQEEAHSEEDSDRGDLKVAAAVEGRI